MAKRRVCAEFFNSLPRLHGSAPRAIGAHSHSLASLDRCFLLVWEFYFSYPRPNTFFPPLWHNTARNKLVSQRGEVRCLYPEPVNLLTGHLVDLLDAGGLPNSCLLQPTPCPTSRSVIQFGLIADTFPCATCAFSRSASLACGMLLIGQDGRRAEALHPRDRQSNGPSRGDGC